MNKGDLVSQVAESANITKAQAAKVVDGAIKGIMGALERGEKVTLVGFGTFSVAKRKARTGRNPSTGKELKIPAKQVPRFAAGSKLREAAAKAKM